MLDRLQEDDRVAGLGEALDQVALEAQVGPHVAQPGVLVGLGVGVDPDHARGRGRQDVGAVALAAGHVDHPLAADPLRDPLVDDQVAPVPVVLLRHVGQRPLARQRQRRHAGRLVPLDVVALHGRGPYCSPPDAVFASAPSKALCERRTKRAQEPCARREAAPPPPPRPTHIKDVNTRYHDAAADEYDAKWGIDFGATGQEQVRLKLAKALGGVDGLCFGDGLEIGSGTGYFSLNLMQLGILERLTATDISPGMLQRLGAHRGGVGARRRETVATEAEELPFEDESFDLVFGHAVLHHIPDLERAMAEFRRVLRPGGAIAFCGEPSRYGDRLAAAPKRAGLPPRPPGAVSSAHCLAPCPRPSNRTATPSRAR